MADLYPGLMNSCVEFKFLLVFICYGQHSSFLLGKHWISREKWEFQTCTSLRRHYYYWRRYRVRRSVTMTRLLPITSWLITVLTRREHSIQVFYHFYTYTGEIQILNEERNVQSWDCTTLITTIASFTEPSVSLVKCPCGFDTMPRLNYCGRVSLLLRLLANRHSDVPYLLIICNKNIK